MPMKKRRMPLRRDVGLAKACVALVLRRGAGFRTAGVDYGRMVNEATGSPRTSILGVMPSPGAVEAFMRPWSR